MSVLIIALPRTGSTSLLYKIAEENNFKPLFEPFDNSGRVKYVRENGIVVKTIICHHPNNSKLAKEFDKVILLSRKNLLECAESHAYQVHFSKKKGYNSNHSYYYEEAPEDVFKLCYSNILKWDYEMNELSAKLSIPITYYEDLYDPEDKHRLRRGDRNKSSKKLI
jgi:hypothetical protein